MTLLRSVRVSLCVSLAAFMLAAAASWAANGRDFAGTYQIRNSTSQGSNVKVTLAIAFYNYGEGISDAQVYLADRHVAGENLGAFSQRIAMQKRDSVHLKRTFVVPASEFQTWKQGSSPLFTISFKDATGHTVARRIELLLMPTAEEN